MSAGRSLLHSPLRAMVCNMIALVAGLCSATLAHAQSVTGTLQGTVVDEDGAALAGAEVAIRAPGLRERTLLADHRGEFRALALPSGLYSVRIRFIGRDPVELVDQPVRIGQTTSVGRVVMQPRPLEVSGLTAAATRPLIDPVASTYGGHINRQVFENLPMERDYQTAPAFMPHVNPDILGVGLNFAGGTGLENHFYVEGVNVSDPTGNGGVRLPYNFIKEIEVRTGGYAAEYRGALGGVMNVVTASGTNELAADAFAYFTGNRFAEEPRYGNTLRRGDYALYDFGGTLRGPILRDRVWFFTAWNPSFEREQVPLPGLGIDETDHTVVHRYAAKVNWQPSPRTRLDLTTVGDPNWRDAVGSTAINYRGGLPSRLANPDPFLSIRRGGAMSISLRATHLPNDRTVIETSGDRVRFRTVFKPRAGNIDEPFFIDLTSPDGPMWSGGYQENGDLSLTRTSARVKLIMNRGSHELKLGSEFESARAGGHEFETRIGRESDALYTQYLYEADGFVRNQSLGLFVQDSWAMTRQLRLNAGVRLGTEWAYGTDEKLALKITDEWQPRIGMVLQPTDNQKVSWSYGRYYQPLHTVASSFYFAYGSTSGFFSWDHDPRIDPSGKEGEAVVAEPSGQVLRVRGQHFDEFTLTYERLFTGQTKATIRGLRRSLREAVEDGVGTSGNFVFGNPGRGLLSNFPRATRRYTAVELSLEHAAGERGYLHASYVWSRNRGNYTGLHETDDNYPFPNAGGAFDNAESYINATGLLPNDRTHVFKAAGWFRTRALPLTIGGTFSWQSGTPLSEFGATPSPYGTPAFVRQRGTAGRTDAVRDLNLRASYVLPLAGAAVPTLMVDLFHVFSGETVIGVDQYHYRVNTDGVFSDPSPSYLNPTRYALPMSVRVGVTMRF